LLLLHAILVFCYGHYLPGFILILVVTTLRGLVVPVAEVTVGVLSNY